jgi:hypothetical protein
MKELTKNKIKYNAARAGEVLAFALGGILSYAFIASVLYLFEKVERSYINIRDHSYAAAAKIILFAPCLVIVALMAAITFPFLGFLQLRGVSYCDYLQAEYNAERENIKSSQAEDPTTLMPKETRVKGDHISPKLQDMPGNTLEQLNSNNIDYDQSVEGK